MTNETVTYRDYFLLAANLLDKERTTLVRNACLKDPKAFEFFKNICPNWETVLAPALPEFTVDELNESEAIIREAIRSSLLKDEDFLDPPPNDEPAKVAAPVAPA